MDLLVPKLNPSSIELKFECLHHKKWLQFWERHKRSIILNAVSSCSGRI